MIYIVKIDSKAHGKGVHVTHDKDEAVESVRNYLSNAKPGLQLSVTVSIEHEIVAQFIGLTTEQAEAKATSLLEKYPSVEYIIQMVQDINK